MAFSPGWRRAAAAARARLQTFSSGRMPPAMNIGNRTPTYPSVNPATEQRLLQEMQEVLRSRISVGAGPYNDRISTYPETQLDPQKIDRIFKAADYGVGIYQYADMNHGVRKRDAHLVGIDRQRRHGVANKPFLIWARDDTEPLAVGMAHAMRAMYDGIDGFSTAMYATLSKNCDGWSTTEIVYAPGAIRFQKPDGNGGGEMLTVRGLWPRQLIWVHGKHTQFSNDSADEPLLDMGRDGVVRLPKYKFLYSVAPGEGVASSRGYARSVVWMHFFKHAKFRDWVVFLHIYGIPFLQGKVSREYWKDTSMKSVLSAAMQAYGTGDTGVILPDGLSIEVHDPVSMGAAGDAHKSLIGICNAEQSKAVLGEMLTIEPGESGSFKLGAVHQDAAQEVIVGDAAVLADDNRRDIMLQAIELNADALAQAFNVRPEELPLAVPACGFRTDREWSPEQRQKIFSGAMEDGVEVSEAQYRRELQVDKPTSPKDVLRGKAVTVPSGGAAVGATTASEGVVVPKPEANEPQPA
jgi:phage gp29-like protein